ncbi:hypothetical protein BQ8482_111151 [Mesorhizobium delmotii]|uniref:Uncharacterized protein n=1 Tax=Mesorhizobium delmotii TaxID=1631247 RepID=A0A2P9ADM0_9HYPH|nr:hypothetical protein BQ8482_111151 [Mesorhizobium delmotii]
MRAQLLPALPPGRADGAADRYVYVPSGVPLHCTQNVTNTARKARRPKACRDRDRQGG